MAAGVRLVTVRAALAIIVTWCGVKLLWQSQLAQTVDNVHKANQSQAANVTLQANFEATTRALDELQKSAGQKQLELEVQLDELRKQLELEIVGRQPRQPRVADDECEWWQAPVIVGGTEGSGTRGVVANVGSQGAHIMGTDAACMQVDPIYGAMDTDCIVPKWGWFARGAWRSEVAPQAKDKWDSFPQSLEEVFALTDDPDRTRKAMLGLHERNKRPWGWTWKMPHTMFQFPDLLKVFPCARYVHALRDPRDLAAKPEDHTSIRVNDHLFTVAFALGFNGTTNMTRQAGAFLCGHAQTRARGENSSALCRQYLQPIPVLAQGGIPSTCCGVTTPEFIHRIQTEPGLQRAIQCATLLSWQSNSLFHRWARTTLPQNAYLPYQIELSGEGAWGLAAPQREAVRALMGLEASTPPHRRGKAQQRRAPDWQSHIGKWHTMIGTKRMRELEHCGNWKDVMQDMYVDAVETAVAARN